MKSIGAGHQHNTHIAILNLIQSLTQLLKSTPNSQLLSEKKEILKDEITEEITRKLLFIYFY